MADDENISKNNEEDNLDLTAGTDGDAETDGDAGGRAGTGAGSQGGGQIEFHDFLVTGERVRDDLLSVDEKRRLLSVHKDNHEAKVKKQKDLLARRKEVRDGKMNLAEYRRGRGYGAGMNGLAKTHPLSNTAQFGSGSIDNNVNAVPDENTAETNNENRNELEYQYRLENRPQQAYTNRYSPPKPSPFK